MSTDESNRPDYISHLKAEAAELQGRLEEMQARLDSAHALLSDYRRFVGKLATNRDKANAWYTAKAWAGKKFWFSLGSDLATEAEQKAFLFE